MLNSLRAISWVHSERLRFIEYPADKLLNGTFPHKSGLFGILPPETSQDMLHEEFMKVLRQLHFFNPEKGFFQPFVQHVGYRIVHMHRFKITHIHCVCSLSQFNV